MANQVVKLKDGDNYLYPYANFMGIDFSNIIATVTLSTEYTATQDCIVSFFISNRVGEKILHINDMKADTAKFSIGSDSSVTPVMYNCYILPLKKGGIVKVTGVNAKLYIYGIKY